MPAACGGMPSLLSDGRTAHAVPTADSRRGSTTLTPVTNPQSPCCLRRGSASRPTTPSQPHFVPSTTTHLGCKKRANDGSGEGWGGRNPCKSLVGAPGFEPG